MGHVFYDVLLCMAGRRRVATTEWRYATSGTNELSMLYKVQLIYVWFFATNDDLYQGHHAQRRCPSKVQ